MTTTLHFWIAGLFWILGINPVQSRWERFDDAPVKMVSRRGTVQVHDDFSVTRTLDAHLKIVTEKGRLMMAKWPFTYTADNETAKLIYAQVLENGQWVDLPPNAIEDKPIASLDQGFDQKKRLTLGFSDIKEGSEIRISLRLTQKHPPIPQLFSDTISFGTPFAEQDRELVYLSAMPLTVHANDPTGVLQVTQDRVRNEQGQYVTRITLKRPFYGNSVSEPDHAQVASENETFVVVTSDPDWDHATRLLAQDYEAVLSETLPPLLQKIRDVAAQKMSEKDQVATVIQLLNQQVQYLGDWRSVKGRMVPHTLKDIAVSKFVDCKSFAAATGAILRAMGYKAHCALVFRGIEPFYKAPLFQQHFNHAILKVVTPTGKPLWIDATNILAMADGIFPDIENRMALVLGSPSTYEHIPSTDPAHAQTHFYQDIQVEKQGHVHCQGRMELKGESALDLMETVLLEPAQKVQDTLGQRIMGSLLAEGDMFQAKLPQPTRVVHDMTIPFSYTKAHGAGNTNMGYQLSFASQSGRSFADATSDQEGDLYVGPAHTELYVTRIKGMRVPGVQHLNRKIETEWLNIDRRAFYEGTDTVIRQTTIIKTNFVSAKDVRSSAYRRLQQDLKRWFSQTALIIPYNTPKRVNLTRTRH